MLINLSENWSCVYKARGTASKNTRREVINFVISNSPSIEFELDHWRNPQCLYNRKLSKDEPFNEDRQVKRFFLRATLLSWDPTQQSQDNKGKYPCFYNRKLFKDGRCLKLQPTNNFNMLETPDIYSELYNRTGSNSHRRNLALSNTKKHISSFVFP